MPWVGSNGVDERAMIYRYTDDNRIKLEDAFLASTPQILTFINGGWGW